MEDGQMVTIPTTADFLVFRVSHIFLMEPQRKTFTFFYRRQLS
jgi:hypothetical protein